MNTYVQNRRYLLFSSVDSSRSAHDLWLKDDQRNFDVVLYVYRGDIDDRRVDFKKNRRGFKFENFYEFSRNADVSRYDAVWIVDDDIRISTEDINALFELFITYRLQIGQPAYSPGSFTPLELCFADDRYHMRYSNFCENGVVLFSSHALQKCLPVMQDIKTGWSSEYLFYKLIGSPERGVGIIDDVTCFHPCHESSLDQIIPRSLHSKEFNFLSAKYGYKIYVPRILGGIRKNGPN